jgi:glycosyltransferase involved in cell wall biosynthesis
MISWLTQQDHFVAAATKHPVAVRYRPWEVPGTDKTRPIVCGTNINVINDDVMDAWQMDACISMFDVWGLKKPIKRHIPWIPIDTENVSEKIIKVIKDCPMQIAMTQHGKRELESFDLEPEYAPIGYDPETFHPDPDLGGEFREAICAQWKDGLKPDDMFLIGSVGLNYPDDRKGFILLLQAFRKFRDKHPEARLYLHTQGVKEQQGMNYARVAQELELMDYVGWADPAQFYFNGYEATDLAGIYSAMDVFCLPTRGEGFGMPVMEAQACGTPVVVTRNTSGPELCKSGVLIGVDDDDYVYTGLNTWRVQPKPSAITGSLGAIRALTVAPCTLIDDTTEEIVERISEYTWPNVWKSHWQPIVDKIESMLPLETPEVEEADEMMAIKGE